MAIGEQGDQQPFDQIGLADDFAGKRHAQGLEVIMQPRSKAASGGIGGGDGRDLIHRTWTSTGEFRFPIIAGACAEGIKNA
ncbi:hypothetical protein GCM10027214_30380 [Stenotrophomonas tumulicola]